MSRLCMELNRFFLFNRELEDILKVIKWPFVSANFSLQTPSQTNIQKMQTTCEYLLQVELPEEITTPAVTSGLLSGFQPLCLPIYYMLLPLRKRFLYHFYGNRQTNRIDKPEWYFTQILSWIRDHVDFVVKWIQPLIDKLGMHHIDVKVRSCFLFYIRFCKFNFIDRINERFGTTCSRKIKLRTT